jgi:hypothetical protein
VRRHARADDALLEPHPRVVQLPDQRVQRCSQRVSFCNNAFDRIESTQSVGLLWGGVCVR